MTKDGVLEDSSCEAECGGSIHQCLISLTPVDLIPMYFELYLTKVASFILSAKTCMSDSKLLTLA
jgi:hypothetical protein